MNEQSVKFSAICLACSACLLDTIFFPLLTMPELLCKVGNTRMGPSDLREQNRCRCRLKKNLKGELSVWNLLARLWGKLHFRNCKWKRERHLNLFRSWLFSLWILRDFAAYSFSPTSSLERPKEEMKAHLISEIARLK